MREYSYGTHTQPGAAHGASYIILSLIIGTVRSCTIFNSPGSIQHCSHVVLVTCRTTIVITFTPKWRGALRVKCIAQGRKIKFTMYQRWEGKTRYLNKIFI